MESVGATRVVHAVCSLDCPDSCGVLVTVANTADGGERAVKVAGDPAHPVTRGFLCGKVARYLDRVYAPDRLLYPMRRRAGVPKGTAREGAARLEAFERISAGMLRLIQIAERLSRIVEKPSGARRACCRTAMRGRSGSWAMGRWTGGSFIGWARRSWTGRSAATAGGAGVYRQVYGVKLGTRAAKIIVCMPGLVICVGSKHVHGNNIHLWPFIEEARRKRCAAGGDRSLQDAGRRRWRMSGCRSTPGTDGLLALGIMHVIFQRGAGGCGVPAGRAPMARRS